MWPNYVAEHAGFFQGGDVDGGRVDEEVVRGEGIEVPPGMGMGMGMGKGEEEGEGEGGSLEGTLRWLVRRIMEEL